MKTCRFCKKKYAQLIEAHIIPRSFFEYSRRIADVSKNYSMEQITNKKNEFPKRRIRIGWYDANLVCQTCEKIFGPYDEYAFELLLKNESQHQELVSVGGNLGWIINNYDFEKLRLFVISVLWRAGASEMPIFAKIELGKWLETAREYIFTQDTVIGNKFSFILARFPDKNGRKFTADPHREAKGETFDRLNVYRFYLGAGYICYIKVDSRPFIDPFFSLTPSEGHPLIISTRSDFMDSHERFAFQKVITDAQGNFNGYKK